MSRQPPFAERIHPGVSLRPSLHSPRSSSCYCCDCRCCAVVVPLLCRCRCPLFWLSFRSEAEESASFFALSFALSVAVAVALLAVIPQRSDGRSIRAKREPGGSRGLQAPEEMPKKEGASASVLKSLPPLRRSGHSLLPCKLQHRPGVNSHAAGCVPDTCPIRNALRFLAASTTFASATE